ncbi:flagellar hook-length control protein FliK [Oceanimonas doudoroffii]|uniref:Flagellar hook-length control protein-like C-terminal domain-containing protein n=1 Tax=Oceanimonas doudoroffii TaxID=84158 RepID=A0A233RIN4_9GAMM|nr:flagellar hook-length control protein FliK [Oceanimonas doudoroffii]OXY83249.1 hypothetical protein B6S08_07090 [Oceanimonas doudoroffii]
MTTVIPALFGGMNSSRAALQPGEAGKPSGFSELLSKAGAETGDKGMPAVPGADSGEERVMAESTESGANKLSTVDATTNEAAESDETDSSPGDTKEGFAAGDAVSAVPAEEIPSTAAAVGGKPLPEAATAAADLPEAHAEPLLQGRREPAQPVAQAVWQDDHASADSAEPDMKPAKTGSSAANESFVTAQQAAVKASSPGQHSTQAQPEEPPSGNPPPVAAKAETAGPGDKGIPAAALHAGMTGGSERATTTISSSGKAGDQPAQVAPPVGADDAGAEALPKQPSDIRHSGAQPPAAEQAGRASPLAPEQAETARASSPVPVNTVAGEGPDMTGETEAEPAIAPRQDVASVRQERTATPDWLAQIEHGRRWQQTQQGQATEPGVKGDAEIALKSNDGDEQAAIDLSAGTIEGSEGGEELPLSERSASASLVAQGTAGDAVTRSAAGVSDPQLVTTTAATRDAAPAPERVPQPLGERMLNLHQASPEQNARQLSQQVQVMVSQDLQQADIRLNPSELGGMRIQLRFEQGELSMHIQAQHPQARELLEQAMPRLRDMLGQQGIQLGQGQVGGFAGQQGGAQNGASGQDATGPERGHNPSPFEQGPSEDQAAYGSRGANTFFNDGRIDFFA